MAVAVVFSMKQEKNYPALNPIFVVVVVVPVFIYEKKIENVDEDDYIGNE